MYYVPKERSGLRKNKVYIFHKKTVKNNFKKFHQNYKHTHISGSINAHIKINQSLKIKNQII